MKLERRSFISQISVATAALAIGKPLSSAASTGHALSRFYQAPNCVNIYHTVNSNRVGGPLAGGGSGLPPINSFIGKQKIKGLLLDNGNFLAGDQSALLNYRVIALMNQMGYQAAAVGERELSGGEEALAKLIPAMNFSLVNCNYQFGPALNKLVVPYLTIYSGKIKIGVTGVGDKLPGTGFSDPLACANNIASILKEKEKCDLVVCLSRLSFSREGDAPDNQKLAKGSAHIDFVIGEHSSTPTNSPLIKLNKNKQEVLISQAASFGRISCSFSDGKQKNDLRAKHFILQEAGLSTV
jgi:5'-nucleotidase